MTTNGPTKDRTVITISPLASLNNKTAYIYSINSITLTT